MLKAIGNGAGVDPDEALLMSERIGRSLANEIATGNLPPGTPLDEQSVADRFGASRTPVRDAFRQLAVDGLIDLRPRRQVIVAQLSREYIVDMFEASAEIEALCVRLATHRMNPTERNRLRQLHDESEAMVTDGNVEGYSDLNIQFHETIYRATHNRVLAEQAIALRKRLLAFRRAQLFETGRPALSRGEHDDILWAIMRGDGDEAARRMRAHMFSASSALERYVAAHAVRGSGDKLSVKPIMAES